MNETVLKEILGEALKREFMEFDDASEHKFSLKHKIAMKRIFLRYERNMRKTGAAQAAEQEYEPSRGLKRRLIVAMVVIILMTLLTGWFIPIRGITEEQIDWLRSRYDFSNMKARVRYTFINDGGQTQYGFKRSDEYSEFLDDLKYLGIYSEKDLIDMYTVPLDTRTSGSSAFSALTEFHKSWDSGDSLLEVSRTLVSYLENTALFYEERSRDPYRAVDGDAEFADLIKHCLLLPKGFYELIEKLCCDIPADESRAGRNKSLFDFDKDDKVHLLKVNKL